MVGMTGSSFLPVSVTIHFRQRRSAKTTQVRRMYNDLAGYRSYLRDRYTVVELNSPLIE